MKILNLILICCLLVCYTIKSSSENNNKDPQKEIRFDGFLRDVNSNENLILYELPENFTSEYGKAKLICHQMISNSDIVLSDSVMISGNLHAKFFNDTIIVVPTAKDIWLYNLKQERYFDRLTNLPSGEYIYAFNISQNKEKIAFVIFNLADNKFTTYCLDLVTNTMRSVEHIIPDEGAEYYCYVYLVNGHTLFSINNNLYDFVDTAKKDKLLTNQLSFNAYGSYLYAVDLSNVIFIEGYDKNTIVKSYNLSNGEIKQITSSLNIPQKYDSKIIILRTINYNNQLHTQLFRDIPYLFENNDFVKQNEFLDFKGNNIKINRIIENNKEGFMLQTVK